MTSQKIKMNKGFVILFAVTISAILLSIALGVSNIALKEVKFSTSAKDTNDAFFAADTGVECALFYDKSLPANNAYTGGASFIGPMSCAGSNITLNGSSPAWNFIVTGLSANQSCVKVTVTKTFAPNTTAIISKGYNIGDASCASTNPSRVEREIDVNY